MLITIIAGARPNFMKIAPIIKAIKIHNQSKSMINYRLVHTGQHFDKAMSGDFFEQLGIPNPDINLECGGGTQAEQTAAIMVKFEQELINHPPDVVLVVGDVTSTMACSITAKKLCVPVVHVEAGIRSGDMTMPEEINRIVTDSITDHFFTTSEHANQTLRSQEIGDHRIHFVGNTMIDTLLQNLDKIRQPTFFDEKQLHTKSYFLLTLHRPSNVDNPEKLSSILYSIMGSVDNYQVLFPVHPRTKKMLSQINFNHPSLICIDPQPYHEFMFLIKNSKGIITDSGGITEEATVLHIPCLTLRTSTERPETITEGTNELIGDDMDKLRNCIDKIIKGNWKTGSVPKLWDGKTSERIVKILSTLYESR